MVFTLRFTGTLNKFDGTIEPHCWQSKGFATAADASGAWPAIQAAMAIDGPKYQGGTAVIGNPQVTSESCQSVNSKFPAAPNGTLPQLPNAPSGVNLSYSLY